MCLTHKQTSEYIYFTQPIQKVFVLMCKQMSKPPPPTAFPAAAHKVQGYRRSVSASKTTTTTTTSCEPSEPKPSQGNPAPGQESVEFSCRQALQCITHTLSLSSSICLYVSLSRQYKNGYVSEFIPCAAAVKFYTMRRSQQMDFFCMLNFCSDFD